MPALLAGAQHHPRAAQTGFNIAWIIDVEAATRCTDEASLPKKA